MARSQSDGSGWEPDVRVSPAFCCFLELSASVRDPNAVSVSRRLIPAREESEAVPITGTDPAATIGRTKFGPAVSRSSAMHAVQLRPVKARVGAQETGVCSSGPLVGAIAGRAKGIGLPRAPSGDRRSPAVEPVQRRGEGSANEAEDNTQNADNDRKSQELAALASTTPPAQQFVDAAALRHEEGYFSAQHAGQDTAPQRISRRPFRR